MHPAQRFRKLFRKFTYKFSFFIYSISWEQRKLGDVGATYTGLSGKTKEDFGHGNGKFVTYMNVFSNTVGLPDMVEPVEIDDTQNKVLYGDVLFTTSSETPEEVGMSSVWLENAENTYLNSFCFGYRPTVEFNPYYLAYMLRSFSMREKIKFLAQGISRYNISKNKMMYIEMPIPNIEEQEQIGTYFRTINNLITLHQRKLEKLKTFKKAMLDKMFPKNGELVPEIRFSGFTDPWEQRKVGDYVDITTGKLDANAMKEDGKYDFYTSGIQKYKIDVSAFEGPAITIAGNGATVGYMHLADGKFNAYQRTYVLTDFQADRHFLFFEIGNKLPKKITQEARTGNIPYIVMDMLTNLQIVIPEKSEQEKIGQYIQQLDNLITLHQRKPYIHKKEDFQC